MRMTRVAVAGGTGLMGRLVVERLDAAGHKAVVLARSRGVDLLTGTGVDAALAGCSAVVDVTNVGTASGRRSREFFGTVTDRLLTAGVRAGVGHVVALSIVGVDRVGLGYYRGKLHQEELLAAGPLPWTVLRATQFHAFAAQLADRGRGRSPVVLVPRALSRPVDAAEVADRLAALAVGPAHGTATPMAGPEVIPLPEMVRRLLRARGSRRRVVPVPVPGAAGRAAARGGLLPDGDVVLGVHPFDAYLRSEQERTVHECSGQRQRSGQQRGGQQRGRQPR